VVGCFFDGAHHHDLVLDSKTGELGGMLTAFDILKAKNPELMQEMSEPSRLSPMSLLRFGPPTATPAAEA
jgi:hypothetical protein